MTRTLTTLFASAAVLTCLAAPALAAPLWTADWAPLKPNIVSTNGNQLLFSDVAVHDGDATQNILATQITVALPFTGENDFFEHQNYSLQLTLKDVASGQTAVMTFSGDVNGTITPSGSSITNAFDVANGVHDATLGGNLYTVTIGDYEPNGQGANVGSIYATVAVAIPDPGTPGGPDLEPQPNETPEPASLVLAGMGAALSGLGWYRKRRVS